MLSSVLSSGSPDKGVGVPTGTPTVGSITAPGEKVGCGVGVCEGVGVAVGSGDGVGRGVAIGVGVAVGGAGVAVASGVGLAGTGVGDSWSEQAANKTKNAASAPRYLPICPSLPVKLYPTSNSVWLGV